MSHLLTRLDDVELDVEGRASTGTSGKAYSYRINNTYNSGSFGYASPLNAPFYNGTSSSVYEQINTGGFIGLQDSSELVVLRSGTNALYWWDNLTLPAGRWLIRGTYAGSLSGSTEGYLQWQIDSSGTPIGPKALYSATEAGGALAWGVLDTATAVKLRLRFVGSGSFYRAVGSAHQMCSISVSAF